MTILQTIISAFEFIITLFVQLPIFLYSLISMVVDSINGVLTIFNSSNFSYPIYALFLCAIACGVFKVIKEIF